MDLADFEKYQEGWDNLVAVSIELDKEMDNLLEKLSDLNETLDKIKRQADDRYWKLIRMEKQLTELQQFSENSADFEGFTVVLSPPHEFK